MTAELKDKMNQKGNLWEEYKSVLEKYQPGQAISPEDQAALDRMDQEFKNIRDFSERRLQEQKMNEFFSAVDTEKRLPVMSTDEKGEVSLEPKTAEEKRRLDVVRQVNAAIAEGKAYGLRKLGRMTEAADVEKKAMSEGTANAGGYLTPDIYIAEFVNKMYVGSWMRVAGAKKITLRSDISRVPAMSSASSAAVIIAEAGGFTDHTPTLGEVVFTAVKVGDLKKVSWEVVADSEVDLLSEVLLPDFAQSIAQGENGYFTTGTGSGQPTGLITGIGTTNNKTAASATAFTAAEVIDTLYTCPVQYRNLPSFGFMAHDTIHGYIRKLADSQGRFFWEPSYQAGQPDKLLGKPIYPNNSMDSALTTGKKLLVTGAFNYYWIGDRQQFGVQTLNELYAANGQVGYIGYERVDGQLMQAEAFSLLKLA